VLVLAGICLFVQAGTALAEDPLLIGLLLPPEESAALSLGQGAQLAVHHSNEQPGPKASLVIRGRPGQWGDDGVEAARMVLDDGARGLIAPSGGAASHLSLQVAGRTAIPVASLCGDSSVTGAGIPWMIRLAPGTSNQVHLLLAAVARPKPAAAANSKSSGADSLCACASSPSERQNAPRWVVFVPDGRAGREIRGDMEKAAGPAWAALGPIIEVATNTVQWGDLAKQAAQVAPNGVLLWLDCAPAGHLAAALRSAGFRGALAGPMHLQSPAFLKVAGAAAEGVHTPGLSRDAASSLVLKRFSQAYQDRYSMEPDFSAILAYDAAALLIHVLREAGPETPHRAFPLTTVLPGASGPLAFDRAGNRVALLNLQVCHHGSFAAEPETR
jgi:ABC-type branched-subunit amino acid transport system substrate-binding protein